MSTIPVQPVFSLSIPGQAMELNRSMIVFVLEGIVGSDKGLWGYRNPRLPIAAIAVSMFLRAAASLARRSLVAATMESLPVAV